MRTAPRIFIKLSEIDTYCANPDFIKALPMFHPSILCKYCGQVVQNRNDSCKNCAGDLRDGQRLIGYLNGSEVFVK
jgi:recombinational DNA repair protein RecR